VVGPAPPGSVKVASVVPAASVPPSTALSVCPPVACTGLLVTVCVVAWAADGVGCTLPTLSVATL
jgi:hypothetical protein